MRYLILARFYEKLESTTKRLEKTFYLSQLLKAAHGEELDMIILLVQGRLFPTWDETEIGVASKLVIKALSLATGMGTEAISRELKGSGDLGTVAEKLSHKKFQATLSKQNLSVQKVFANLRKLAGMTGSGSVDQKVQLMAELLASADPLEARYVIRTILGQLRVGVGSGSMRDAIAWAYFPKVIGVFHQCTGCKTYVPDVKSCLECGTDINPKQDIPLPDAKVLSIRKVEDIKKLNGYDLIEAPDDAMAREAYNYIVSSVQSAYDMSNDFAEVARKAAEHGIEGLGEVSMTVGRPVKVMLAIKADTYNEAFERVAKPAQLEYKLDGFRMQVHKKGRDITIFTRRLENVTRQFPDVVRYVRENVHAEECILDSEAVGFDPKSERYMPFQHISQRIRRKYGIEEMVGELPIELNVFDILWHDGNNLITEPFRQRRAIIQKILKPVHRKIVLSKAIITSSDDEARKFFSESKAAGNEGIMFKNLDAPYRPGARVGYMVKYKETMETLDLVIVGAEWGHGKRANWLSSFTVACRKDGEFLELGKVGTGIKEKDSEGLSFADLTKLLKPSVIKEEGTGVQVKPDIVVEVAYEEIQQSPTYSSGFALRFPRVIRLREDRSPKDCDTLARVTELFESQRFKSK